MPGTQLTSQQLEVSTCGWPHAPLYLATPQGLCCLCGCIRLLCCLKCLLGTRVSQRNDPEHGIAGLGKTFYSLIRAQEEVTGFQPRPEDLDYPARLQQVQPSDGAEAGAAESGRAESAAAAEQAERRPLKADRNGDAGAAADDSQVRP